MINKNTSTLMSLIFYGIFASSLVGCASNSNPTQKNQASNNMIVEFNMVSYDKSNQQQDYFTELTPIDDSGSSFNFINE